MNEEHKKFMRRAISLAKMGVEAKAGGPFGAVVVIDGEIIGEGWNSVTSTNDPTAHAEVVAIRNACETLNSFQLDGCILYASCEPCPMCLGAIYWARPTSIFFACNRNDAANAGFDDQFIYDEIAGAIDDRRIESVNMMRDEALTVFKKWNATADKIGY